MGCTFINSPLICACFRNIEKSLLNWDLFLPQLHGYVGSRCETITVDMMPAMVAKSMLPAISPDSNLSRYLDQIRAFPMLEPGEEYMLAKAWKDKGDVTAAHKLVTSHLRLVAKGTMGYRGTAYLLPT